MKLTRREKLLTCLLACFLVGIPALDSLADSVVPSGPRVKLQATTPGTAQTGNINVDGTIVAGTALRGTLQGPTAANALSLGAVPSTLVFDSDGFSVSATGGGAFALTAPLQVSATAPAAVATTGTNASQTISIASQAGGASSGGATNNTGGTGSNDSDVAGTGGAASGAATGTNTGGAGGSKTYRGGVGGAASGATTANVGGAGGPVTIGGNNGGNGTQTGGAGAATSVIGGNAGTGGNAAAGPIDITPGTATGSGNGGWVRIGRAVAAVRAGLRIVASRIIDANKPTAAVDCAGGAINATVTQLLESGIFTCATAQTLTLPTWQGASGIVQALPEVPAVGDMIHFKMISTAQASFTLAAGTGGTLVGNAVINNDGTTWDCRLTNVGAGTETATCYGGAGTGGSGSEGFYPAYNSANLAAGGIFSQTTFNNASTLVAGSNMIHDIAGAGTGTFVVKLCSDGATCAGGNVYLTCTAGATCAAAVAGRIDACTITKSAIPASTTLTYSVTTACGTTDPGVNLVAHYTTP